MSHTAVLIVVVVVIQDEKVLMMQESKKECYGKWYLPGNSLFSFVECKFVNKAQRNEQFDYLQLEKLILVKTLFKLQSVK
jgi:hypothetical protein